MRVPAPDHKVTLSTDPLDLALPDDYRNWGSLLAQVLLQKEGGMHAATAALARVAVDVHGMLARAADGEVLVPRLWLHDPVLLGGGEGGKAKAGLPATGYVGFLWGAWGTGGPRLALFRTPTPTPTPLQSFPVPVQCLFYQLSPLRPV